MTRDLEAPRPRAGEAPPSAAGAVSREGLLRGLGVYDATMLVMGGMIGSGIFLVTPYMARLLGSSGWLLAAWIVTGVLTLAGALSYAELGTMMPRAGGSYVYLREAFSPLAAFLFGWTAFLVSQTGSIAALGVAFARFAGELVPAISEESYLIEPVHVGGRYALSLSTAQLAALAVIAVLTWANVRGLAYGKRVQNVFTTINVAALACLILAALLLGRNAEAITANFADAWAIRDPEPVAPGITAATGFGLLVALCIAQTGSFFSTAGWENVTFTGGEVANPRRTIPLALALGAGGVLALYLLVNVGYLVTLPLDAIREVPADRVATATLARAVPAGGAALMAAAIALATFGCNNAQILCGARIYYAMARDGLFFDTAARLNRARVPGVALTLQGVWSGALVLPRIFQPESGTYGNLYSDLLNYATCAILLFYVVTVACVFRLRRLRPHADRPYRTVGYPWVPTLFLVGAGAILLVMFVYQPYTSWPGLALLGLGVPVYFARRRLRPAGPAAPSGGQGPAEHR